MLRSLIIINTLENLHVPEPRLTLILDFRSYIHGNVAAAVRKDSYLLLVQIEGSVLLFTSHRAQVPF